TQIVDHPIDRRELYAGRQTTADSGPDGVRQVDGLESESAAIEFADRFGDHLRALIAGGVGDDFEIWRFALGLLGRPRVGQQQALRAGDKQVAGRVTRWEIVTRVAAQVVARFGL